MEKKSRIPKAAFSLFQSPISMRSVVNSLQYSLDMSRKMQFRPQTCGCQSTARSNSRIVRIINSLFNVSVRTRDTLALAKPTSVKQLESPCWDTNGNRFYWRSAYNRSRLLKFCVYRFVRSKFLLVKGAPWLDSPAGAFLNKSEFGSLS